MNENTISRWKWLAVYRNGGLLFSYDASFYDIDQDRLKKLEVYNDKRKIIMQFEQGRKLIIYTTHYGTVGGEDHEIFCFGWQKGKEKRIFKLYEDGTMEIT